MGIQAPSTKAMRAAPMGPRKGMGLTMSAAEAAFRAITSYGCSSSTDSTVATMWVSQR